MLQEEVFDNWNSDQVPGASDTPSRTVQTFWGGEHLDQPLLRRTKPQGQNKYTLVNYHLTDPQGSTVALLDGKLGLGGGPIERVSYTAYGWATQRWGLDANGDGSANTSDYALVNSLQGKTVSDALYDPDCDLNCDGVINSKDLALANAATTGPRGPVGSGLISDAKGPDNPIGYCGYLFNPECGLYTVRFRHYSPGLGRWIEPDPAGYVDGSNLYEYGASGPLDGVDELGLVYTREGEIQRIRNVLKDQWRLSPAERERLHQRLADLEGREHSAWCGRLGYEPTAVERFIRGAAETVAVVGGIIAFTVAVVALIPEAIVAAVAGATAFAIIAATAEIIGTAVTFYTLGLAAYELWTGNEVDWRGRATGRHLTIRDKGELAGSMLANLVLFVGSSLKFLGKAGAEADAAAGVRPPATRPVGELREAGLKDAHHVIQDAAVRDLLGYDTNAAPGVQLPGPSTARGTPHYLATQVQRAAGGGTYGAERAIAYQALRAAGYSEEQALRALEQPQPKSSAVRRMSGCATSLDEVASVRRESCAGQEP